jgi:hypothetical protein
MMSGGEQANTTEQGADASVCAAGTDRQKGDRTTDDSSVSLNEDVPSSEYDQSSI